MEWTNTIKILEEVGQYSVDEYRKKLDTPDPFTSNATYTLYKGVNYRIENDDNNFKIYFIIPDSEFDKGTQQIYLDQGRKPGKFPPIQAIKDWVIVRGINFGKGPESAAWAIQRSIGFYGIPNRTKGRPKKNYLDTIMAETVVKDYPDRIRKAIESDIDEYLKTNGTK